MKTVWICQKCGYGGVIEHDDHADVYTVIELLRQAHRKVPVQCEADLNRIAVAKAVRD